MDGLEAGGGRGRFGQALLLEGIVDHVSRTAIGVGGSANLAPFRSNHPATLFPPLHPSKRVASVVRSGMSVPYRSHGPGALTWSSSFRSWSGLPRGFRASKSRCRWYPSRSSRHSGRRCVVWLWKRQRRVPRASPASFESSNWKKMIVRTRPPTSVSEPSPPPAKFLTLRVFSTESFTSEAARRRRYPSYRRSGVNLRKLLTSGPCQVPAIAYSRCQASTGRAMRSNTQIDATLPSA